MADVAAGGSVVPGTPADGDWLVIGEAAAKRHPLYGIGGWLTVVLVAAAVAPPILWVALYVLHSAVVTVFGPMDSWGPEFAAFRLIYVGHLVIQALLGIAAWVALANVRRPWFADAVGLCFLLSLLVEWLFVLGTSWSLNLPFAEPMEGNWLHMIGRTVGTIALVWYVIASKRVNVTYRLRVRRDDPFLSPSPGSPDACPLCGQPHGSAANPAT